jgi:hypothetical protein
LTAREIGLFILHMNLPSSPAAPGASRAAWPWRAAVRHCSLSLLIAGFLVIAFQSRTDPRPPARGAARLSHSVVSPVKFSPPERRGLSLDPEAETVATVLVTLHSVSLGVVPTYPRRDEARRKSAARLRAPPLI